MSIEAFGYKQELKRSLSLTDLVVYGMIFMIPIAPFGVYGYVNAEAPGMVPLAYIIGMVAMLFTALSYGSMAQAFPVAGSVYSYAQRGLNPHVGFIAGWLMLLDYLLIPPLLYVYAAMALNHLYPDIPKVGFILAFLVSATFVNLRGITFTARMNIIFLLAQLVVLGIFLFYAWNALHGGAGNGQMTLAPLYSPEHFNFALLMQAVSIAVLSFLGFDAISTLAEEIKGDPGRSIGKAALMTLLVMGAIFVVQTWIATDLAAGMGFKSADTAFYEIAELAAGSWLATLTAVATALAWGVAVAITSQAAVSRLLFGMARDGKLPKVLAKVHPKHNTPYMSIYLVAVLSLLICYLFINAVDTLTSLVNFGALSGFMLLHITVINHYWRRQRSGQLIRHLICPLIGFGIVAAIMYNMGVDAQKLGLVWIAAGLVYLCALNKFGSHTALPDPAGQ
ncbi:MULTISPECIES: APC family permease [unclassified Pseudomonas]|uniref:APC family permease n=1 Tax=unclassified Pseudomonas TaxID=196821 RepID=UPI001199FC00|nr:MULTISPECIES: APC family permease [unclassified Pseudomonas]TWC21056.1 amino acid/polyamine/organocation transporter (APC superfamily) [Pseudomonas sp. SJZ075]TWC23626.1 amino acid/polyamine/organocation transporter (APC superfamily) [Pseudomonas sp. SJZ074]TWC36536.1 amino acid/polyamine/organocation transporter (APC superfamily) [Pseudomonas sp. SJZ078]TWC40427.1 amino acid/polyamine/organocation transporter (APC superfamily) [Pseudomonas sp. SJZ085]TWC57295.1 amino acid/polyamine/organoc